VITVTLVAFAAALPRAGTIVRVDAPALQDR